MAHHGHQEAPDPVPGNGPSTPSTLTGNNNPTTPSRNAANPPWVGCTIKGDNLQPRQYQQFISDSTSNANNIVQLKFVKIEKNDCKPINLTDSQIGELLIDVLGLNDKDCLEIDMKTGRYDTRQLLVPANTNQSKILTTGTRPPHVYRDHEVFASLLNNQHTKVTFQGVPIGTPDVELLYLCSHYGEVTSNKVERKAIRVGSGTNRYTLTSTNRIVSMKLHPGKSLKNYYWLAPQGVGKPGWRVLVLHSNQPRQCGHCFKFSPPHKSPPHDTHCKGGSNAKLCKSQKTPRPA